jgi:hypothetical protein
MIEGDKNLSGTLNLNNKMQIFCIRKYKQPYQPLRGQIWKTEKYRVGANSEGRRHRQDFAPGF